MGYIFQLRKRRHCLSWRQRVAFLASAAFFIATHVARADSTVYSYTGNFHVDDKYASWGVNPAFPPELPKKPVPSLL